MSSDIFKRYEFKYHLPALKAVKLIEEVGHFTAGDKYSAKGAYQVNTLYFDSAGFGCYDEKKAGLKFRKKIRLRYYEPELKKDTPIYL